MKVEILRCPWHAAYWAIAVNDRRITPTKCCGAWSSVKAWKMNGRTLAAELRRAARGGRA